MSVSFLKLDARLKFHKKTVSFNDGECLKDSSRSNVLMKDSLSLKCSTREIKLVLDDFSF